jgi:hypothetical protein
MKETMETIYSDYASYSIDSITAIERLQEHCSMSSKEAELIVEGWDYEKADQKWHSQ